jgi:hypothetical protein
MLMARPNLLSCVLLQAGLARTQGHALQGAQSERQNKQNGVSIAESKYLTLIFYYWNRMNRPFLSTTPAVPLPALLTEPGADSGRP